MSRRRQAIKRPIVSDAKYQSTLVSRLVNVVMERGEKSVAQRIVYGALDQIARKNQANDPLEILQRAVDNVKPRLEVKALALRWLVKLANARKGIPVKQGLAIEILEAYQGQGNAIRKRDEVHKMAQANKAFAHYRW